MKKVFAPLVVAALVASTLSATAASTNIVQNIIIQLTFLTQGLPLTNRIDTQITSTILKTPVSTSGVIAWLGTAMNPNSSTNTFSSQARLVRVEHFEAQTNFTTIQIRDGSNAPVDVTAFFAGTHVTENIQRTTQNLLTGIPSGPGVGILFLNFTNAPRFNLVSNFSISGVEITTSFGLAVGEALIPADELNAINMAGTGDLTNGVPGVVFGGASFSGSTVEIQ